MWNVKRVVVVSCVLNTDIGFFDSVVFLSKNSAVLRFFLFLRDVLMAAFFWRSKYVFYPSNYYHCAFSCVCGNVCSDHLFTFSIGCMLFREAKGYMVSLPGWSCQWYMLVSRTKPCKSKYEWIVQRNCEWLGKTAIVSSMVNYYSDNRSNSRAKYVPYGEVLPRGTNWRYKPMFGDSHLFFWLHIFCATHRSNFWPINFGW